MKLEARGIEKTYRSKGECLTVLKKVDFAAQPGEFIALLGASGAGKSTLLHVLGGLDRPNAGEVFLDGNGLYAMKERGRAALRCRCLGFVFQFYHLLPEFTAWENVMLAARIRGAPAQQARAAAKALLERVGLSRRLHHRPSELSGGEQQRVAIARALVNEPRILLCDEPTGNLDSKTGAGICELLLELNTNRGYSLIIATHAQDLARLARRTVRIVDGLLAHA
ncbi:MAG: ABC transporter ATP-binding protein [Candidatus Omnitrophica bacterium]|nr:ABC transporter ATP-binding protein [Candidatus Omnitrophota bacterium]